MSTEGLSGPVAKAIAASDAQPECENDEEMPAGVVYNHEKLICDDSEMPSSEKALIKSMQGLSFAQEDGDSDAECEVIGKKKEDEVEEYFALSDKKDDISFGNDSMPAKKRGRPCKK